MTPTATDRVELKLPKWAVGSIGLLLVGGAGLGTFNARQMATLNESQAAATGSVQGIIDATNENTSEIRLLRNDMSHMADALLSIKTGTADIADMRARIKMLEERLQRVEGSK